MGDSEVGSCIGCRKYDVRLYEGANNLQLMNNTHTNVGSLELGEKVGSSVGLNETIEVQ